MSTAATRHRQPTKVVRQPLPNGGHRLARVPVDPFYSTPLGKPYEEPKTCLGCGAKQQPDGSLPCGH